MPTVKFTVNDEYYEMLERWANEDGVTIQDCVRNRLFNLTNIFTPAEAARRALAQFAPGEYFTLPLVYGEQWTIGSGAGIFGKKFFQYVERECQGQIEFDKMIDCGRRAQYKVL